MHNMPNEAVQLDLRTDGLDSDDIDTAQDIVSNVGFQPNHHDVQVTNGTVNFQPFENTEANQELLEKCVERINNEFSNADTQYEIRENRDRAMPASKRCTITVESGRGNDVSGNTPEATEDSDDAEWRAFADSDGEEKERAGWSSSPTHSSEESTQLGDFEVDITYGDDAPAPETADEWRMWYPCPECKSTALDQIVEEHLSVSATEDGSYGGDGGGIEEYNYIECSDCGEVLLDEIGRD